MPKYEVEVCLTEKFEVEADSEAEAIELAREKVAEDISCLCCDYEATLIADEDEDDEK